MCLLTNLQLSHFNSINKLVKCCQNNFKVLFYQDARSRVTDSRCATANTQSRRFMGVYSAAARLTDVQETVDLCDI